MKSVLLDTGPLVAFLNRRDAWHEWAHEQWNRIRPPMLTCEPVLAESCHLLRNTHDGVQAVIDLMARNVVSVPFRLEEHSDPVARLLRKYADIPMSLADACLVRMTEIVSEPSVFTLDRDFELYRRHGRQRIPLFRSLPM